MKKFVTTQIIFLIVLNISWAQQLQIDGNIDWLDEGTSNSKLLEYLMRNSCNGISNIKVNGSHSNNMKFASIGTFEKGNSNFEMQKGIVLSTGDVNTLTGPNNDSDESYPNSNTPWQGDTDLENILNERTDTELKTYDASYISFDFTPSTNFVSFEYIFSSDEYETSNNFECNINYNDGLAFILSGPGVENDEGINGKNIAKIPNTDLPVSSFYIKNPSNKSCEPINEAYYINRVDTNNTSISSNASTKVMTAFSEVVLGQTYNLKIVITDRFDTHFNSAVFISALNFTELNAPTSKGDVEICQFNKDIVLEIDEPIEGLVAHWTNEKGENLATDALEQGTNYIKLPNGTFGDFYVQFKTKSGCLSDKTKISVNYAPLQRPESKGDVTELCNESVLLEIEQGPEGFIPYWYKNRNEPPINIGDLKISVSEKGNYYVNFVDPNRQCTSSYTRIRYFSKKAAIIGERYRYMCKLSEQTLEAEIPPAQYYTVWYNDKHEVVKENSNTLSITGEMTSKNYYVRYKSVISGCLSDKSALFYIFKSPTKSYVELDEINLTFCQNNEVVILIDEPDEINNMTIEWLDNDENIVDSGENSTKLLPNGGFVRLKYENEGKICFTKQVPINITKQNIPPLTNDLSYFKCTPNETVKLQVQGHNPDYLVEWKKGLTILNRSATSEYTVSKSGEYFVRQIDPETSCSSEWTSIMVEDISVPEITSSQNGNICNDNPPIITVSQIDENLNYHWEFISNDQDEDGTIDEIDACPYTRGSKSNNGCPTKDTDGDGVFDYKDICVNTFSTFENGCSASNDSDNDGVLDNTDNCVFNYNPMQNDEDGDGVGNACDNCSEKLNPLQEDFDLNGKGNACEDIDYLDSSIIVTEIGVTKEISPEKSGIYLVYAKNNDGCYSSKSNIMVNMIDYTPEILFNKNSILKGEELQISVDNSQKQVWQDLGNTKTINHNPWEPYTYKVTATDENGCEVTMEKTFDAITDWTFDLGDDIYYCEGDILETFKVDVSPLASYIWSTGEQRTNTITVNEPGTYSLEVNIGNYTQKDEIKVELNDLEIVPDETYACVNFIDSKAINGEAPYSYSIDGFNFQNNPRFLNIETGTYNLTVKDAKGCQRNSMVNLESIQFNSYITPNYDNRSDQWYINGLESCHNSTITIFDRYGNLIDRGGKSFKWLGTKNGKLVLETDYWFVLDFNDGINKPIKGNIHLKR